MNIALVGVANHGQTILRAIRGSAKLILRSCYDINSEAADQVAMTTGCRVAPTYESLLTDPDLEAVALVTPNFLHLDQATKALAAGKHVFIEKPLAVNTREGKKIVEAAVDANRVLQVGHNTRKRRVFRQAKELIERGVVGDIVSVYANMSFDFGLTKDVPEWKKQREMCSLLPMTQLGIHFIDTLEYLIGPIKSVTCTQRSAILRNKKGEPVTDSVASTITFENGVIGAMQSDYVSPTTYTIVVFGTKAKISCSDDKILVEKPAAGRIESETIQATEAIDGESYFAEIAEFAECVLSRTQPEVDGQSGIRNLAVVEAMLRSAESCQAIPVEDVLRNP